MRVFLSSSFPSWHAKSVFLSCPVSGCAGVLVGTLGAGEAVFGGGLFKERVARTGGGKSGGYRRVAYRRPDTDGAVCLRLCEKRGFDADATGTRGAGQSGGCLCGGDDEQVAALLAAGDVREVGCDGEG